MAVQRTRIEDSITPIVRITAGIGAKRYQRRLRVRWRFGFGWISAASESESIGSPDPCLFCLGVADGVGEIDDPSSVGGP